MGMKRALPSGFCDIDVLAALPRRRSHASFLGIHGGFPIGGRAALVESGLPDGQYADLITGETVEVCFGMVGTGGRPVIIDATLRVGA